MKSFIAGIAGLIGLAIPPTARAVAQIGGGLGLTSIGGCNVSRHVPTTTRQDALAFSASTGCNGGSASGALQAHAATGSVGLGLQGSGSGAGALSLSGFVSLADLWTVHVPAGQPVGYFDVTLHLGLEGSVAPGSVAMAGSHQFLSYALSLGEFGLVPSYLSPSGAITSPGVYAETFSAKSRFYYYGPTVPLLVDVGLYLGINQLQSGSVQFINTASAWIDLPPGFSVTTSSGIPVAFAPVPEPASGGMWSMGLGMLSALALARKRSAPRGDRQLQGGIPLTSCPPRDAIRRPGPPLVPRRSRPCAGPDPAFPDP